MWSVALLHVSQDQVDSTQLSFCYVCLYVHGSSSSSFLIYLFNYKELRIRMALVLSTVCTYDYLYIYCLIGESASNNFKV
ncbi:hypothetical protein ACOSP7_016320 [Xanthoceras sorbifolium]